MKLGNKHTEESKGKMSEAHKGITAWNKGIKGYKHSGSFKSKEKHPNWKGGRIKDSKGYIQIYNTIHPYNVKNYVPEHRLIIENKIGRYLLPTEAVHHINGIKDDNILENLKLFSSRGKHANHHAILNGQKSIRPNDYHYSEKHKKNISKALTGIKRSEETKKKYSEAMKKRWANLKKKR